MHLDFWAGLFWFSYPRQFHWRSVASNLSFVTQVRSPRYRREEPYSQTESRINTFPCGLYSHHSWNCSRNKNYTPVSLPPSISYLCKVCNFKIKISVNISFVCISQLSPQSSSSRKNFKISIFLYVYVHAACLPACLCAWVWKPEASDFTGTGVTGGCELPEVGSRAQEQYVLLTVSHPDSLTSQDGFTLSVIVLDDLEPHILLFHLPNAWTSCRLDLGFYVC